VGGEKRLSIIVETMGGVVRAEGKKKGGPDLFLKKKKRKGKRSKKRSEPV